MCLARLVSSDEATLFDIQPPKACLTVERTTYDDVYRAARYSLQTSVEVMQ